MKQRPRSFTKVEMIPAYFNPLLGNISQFVPVPLLDGSSHAYRKLGVEISVFHSHFMWAASATKAALSGLITEEIMTAADWSSKGTFQKFYYKPSHLAAFESAVLAAKSDASKSHVDMETKPFKV